MYALQFVNKLETSCAYFHSFHPRLMGKLCTFFMICINWYVHWIANLHNVHPMVQANGGKEEEKRIKQMIDQKKNLSLQLASQVGYVAESKVARGESTAGMSSKSKPFG